MPIDRDATLKTAERLLRQGKLDGAIEQYVRLVDDYPRDWSSINALGDLYVRGGNLDLAVAQYVRIADGLFGEGFLPRAAALYKKALKVRGDHEPTLFRLSEIAAQQGLLADAKLYLRQLTQQRRKRGDEKGVAECVIRLAAIDEQDADAQVAAARITEGMGDIAQAVALFQDAARIYEKENRDEDALNARIAAARLSPEDARLRDAVARALIAAGQFERAQPFLSADNVGDDVDLLLAVGRIALLAGREAEAHATLMRVAALAPDRQGAIASLSDELIAAGHVGDGYACVEILVDAALFEAAFDRAVRILEDFVDRHSLVPALLKLVDVYVDAGLEDRMTAVQGRLADAYLETGQAAEARAIAEDLLSRERGVELHVQRLRRALVALGVDDPDAVIARLQETGPQFDNMFNLSETHNPTIADTAGAGYTSDEVHVSVVGLSETPVISEPFVETEAIARSKSLNVDELLAASQLLDGANSQPLAETGPESPAPSSRQPPGEQSEIDLSSMLVELHVTPGTIPLRGETVPPADDEFRPGEVLQFPRAGAEDQDVDGAALLDRAQEHLHRGDAAEAATALQAAARMPKFRFRAAAQLGRLSASRGDLKSAVEWFERAAEAPVPTPDEAFAVLYDLADALDSVGESVRALTVFVELEADAGPYRDVRTRIEQLTRGTAAASRSLNGERR